MTRVAGARAHALEQVVQRAVVERARQHGHRLEPQRMHHRLQLPEPEVPGDEQHALALARTPDRTRSSPSNSTRASIALGRQRAELQQLEQQAAEMSNAPRTMARCSAADRAGNAAATFCSRDPAVRAVEQIDGQPEKRARTLYDRRRHDPHGSDEGPHRQIFETVPHLGGQVGLARDASGFSRRERGNECERTANRESGRRLDGHASAAPTATAGRQIAALQPHGVLLRRQHDRAPRRARGLARCAATSRSREAWWSRKRSACRPRCHPAAARSAKKSLGPRDAGDREDARARRPEQPTRGR